MSTVEFNKKVVQLLSQHRPGEGAGKINESELAALKASLPIVFHPNGRINGATPQSLRTLARLLKAGLVEPAARPAVQQLIDIETRRSLPGEMVVPFTNAFPVRFDDTKAAFSQFVVDGQFISKEVRDYAVVLRSHLFYFEPDAQAYITSIIANPGLTTTTPQVADTFAATHGDRIMSGLLKETVPGWPGTLDSVETRALIAAFEQTTGQERADSVNAARDLLGKGLLTPLAGSILSQWLSGR